MIIDMNLLNLRDFKPCLPFFFVGDFVKHIIARYLYSSREVLALKVIKNCSHGFMEFDERL